MIEKSKSKSSVIHNYVSDGFKDDHREFCTVSVLIGFSLGRDLIDTDRAFKEEDSSNLKLSVTKCIKDLSLLKNLCDIERKISLTLHHSVLCSQLHYQSFLLIR